MENNIQFWNSWNVNFRNFYIILLSIATLCTFALGAAYIWGDALTIGWINDTAVETMPIHELNQVADYFNFSVENSVYITKTWFKNDSIHFFSIASYIYFGIIVLSIIVLITLFTYLDIVYFLAGLTAILVFFISLNTELLLFFGMNNKVLAGIMITTYLGLAYWMNAFNAQMDFFKRIQIFISVSILFGVSIALFSNATNPILLISQSSLAFPLIATLLFLVIIGFENIRFFVYLSSETAKQNGSKSLLQFSIITMLYISNALLLWSKGKFFNTQLDLTLIHPLILFITASITGLWGFKKRSELFHQSFPFNPIGAIFYITLFIISTSTIAYGYLTYNDPLYTCIEYFIIFTQLCFSFVFFMYVLVNFSAPILNNVKVYVYLYQPKYSPLFIVQGLGLLGTFGLLGYNNYFSFHQALSSHHIQLGDYYAVSSDTTMAIQHYNAANSYDMRDHRSNYSLASIYEKQERYNEAYEYYNNALSRVSSPYAFMGLCHVYQTHKQLFPSFFTVRDGVQRFPNSGELKNNLALMYLEINNVDSADIMLQLAYDKVPKASALNTIYLLLKLNQLNHADSILSTYQEWDDLAYEVNVMALKSALNEKYESKALQKITTFDSTLTTQQFTYVYNYTINRMLQNDTNDVAMLNKWIAKDSNDSFRESLLAAKSLKQYYGLNEKRSALLSIHELYNNSPNSTYLPTLLAQWHVENQQFDIASKYYFEAMNNGNLRVQVSYVLSLLESNQWSKAEDFLTAWKTSPEKDKQVIVEIANKIKQANTSSIVKENDLIKLRYIRWNYQNESIPNRLQVAAGIQNKDMKDEAALSLMHEALQLSNYELAGNCFQLVSKNTNENLSPWADQLYTELLIGAQDWSTLKQNQQPSKYVNAILAVIQKDSSKAAKQFIVALSEEPLNDKLAARAIYYLGERDFMNYYEIIVAQLLAFPESTRLSEAFITLCIQNQMYTYAQGELERIEPYMNTERYAYWKKTITPHLL